MRRLSIERELFLGEEQQWCLTSTFLTWGTSQHLQRLLDVSKEKLLVIQLNCLQRRLRKTKKDSFFLAFSFYVHKIYSLAKLIKLGDAYFGLSTRQRFIPYFTL